MREPGAPSSSEDRARVCSISPRKKEGAVIAAGGETRSNRPELSFGVMDRGRSPDDFGVCAAGEARTVSFVLKENSLQFQREEH